MNCQDWVTKGLHVYKMKPENGISKSRESLSSTIKAWIMATSTTDAPTPTTSNAASPSCTTAVPDKYGRVPFDACNSNYNDNPSFEANLAFAALFGASFAAHIVQAILYKKVRPAVQQPGQLESETGKV